MKTSPAFSTLVSVTLACVFTTSAFANWATEIASSEPLHWYRFDEDGDEAIDRGSGGLNGTYLGDVEFDTVGPVGSSAVLEGGGYVLLEEENLDTDWTFEAIFYANVDDGATSQGLIGALTGGVDRMAIKAEQWNSLELLGYTLFGVVDISFNADTPDDFTHVAYVGTDDGVELYVQGEFVGFDATPTGLSRHVLAAGMENGAGSLVDPLTGAIDEIVIFDRALDEAEIGRHFASISAPSLPGDFDADGQLTASDIDVLSAAIRDGDNNPVYDLNADTRVDGTDRQVWIRDLKMSWVGDANLDGEFNSSDFVFVFGSGKYEDAIAMNAGWSDGDWNGDGDFDSSDFVAAFTDGGYELGPRTQVAAVPEPSGWAPVSAALLSMLGWRRGRRQ